MTFQPNGRARIAVRWRWRQDGEVVREAVARITAKLVVTSIERFDRVTGKDRSAFSIHTKPRRLVAYQVGDGPWLYVGVPLLAALHHLAERSSDTDGVPPTTHVKGVLNFGDRKIANSVSRYCAN